MCIITCIDECMDMPMPSHTSTLMSVPTSMHMLLKTSGTRVRTHIRTHVRTYVHVRHMPAELDVTKRSADAVTQAKAAFKEPTGANTA